jgi:hypothetical protein
MCQLSEDMFMPGKAFVQMNSKIFDIFCLKERFIVDVDYEEKSSFQAKERESKIWS